MYQLVLPSYVTLNSKQMYLQIDSVMSVLMSVLVNNIAYSSVCIIYFLAGKRGIFSLTNLAEKTRAFPLLKNTDF